MKKIIFSSLLFSVSLCADTYEQFLQNALVKSPYIRALSVDKDVAKEESFKLLRYENPSVGVDYSKYRSDDGYSVSVSQPIRLWGVNDDKELYSKVQEDRANIFFMHSYAQFIRDISLAYVKYAKLKMLVDLAKQESKIAQNIALIAQKRFKSGTISKKDLLQAELELQMQTIQNQSLELESKQSFYELMKFSNIDKNISLEYNHDFVLENLKRQNPDIELLESQKKSDLAYANVVANSIEWVSLDASYEKEPDQDISTLGFSIPLALFNSKSQEKKIALLKAKKQEYLLENEKRNSNLKIEQLNEERNRLYSLRSQNRSILNTQEKLLGMFKRSYKISKSNLLEFQNIKNQFIQTKKRLIFIKSRLNTNIILTNYMQGAYNE